jgi:hypothetical protein
MKRGAAGKLRTVTIIKIVLGCAFLCLIGLGFLWQKRQIHVLGREIKRLETDYEAIRKHNETLKRTYAAMCSPGELDARARRMNLGLVVPQPEQIVRMAEPRFELGAPKVMAATLSEKQATN